MEIFANKLITLSFIESLPKDKTALLGTAEISLFKPLFRYFNREGDSEVQVPPPPVYVKESFPINYVNPKMLPTEPVKIVPECTVEISLSRPVLTQEELQNGIFATVKLDDISPLPEELTLREGNEKDLTTSNYCSF